MCGIFAYIGNKSAGDIILEGLVILQNRGYDSVGVTTITEERKYITTKFASKIYTCDSIDKLSRNIFQHGKNKAGIGHTRWATHGEKTIKNSHPHFDRSKRFALVHNGVIENYLDIKKFLKEQGIECETETDTEVIVQLLSYYARYDDFPCALRKTLNDLEGTWGLAILDLENPDCITITRRGSPLLIGIGKKEFFIASEISAFSRYTTHYISLLNDEIIYVEKDKISLDANNQDLIENRVKVYKDSESILLSPIPYEHWTLREIKEQEFTIPKALNNGARLRDNFSVHLGGLERNEEKLLKIKNLIIVGCGTSRHAGEFGSFLFRKISGFDSVTVVDASEFDPDYCKYPNLGILALSQSGETQDVIRCLNMADCFKFSIINRVDSTIARMTNCGVYLNAGREVAVASTKTFSSTATVLYMVSIWFAQKRNIHFEIRETMISNLNNLSMCFSKILNNNNIDETCELIAKYLLNRNNLFLLGKGNSTPIANEGALKIKEIGYLHAEGYPGGSLKHGPFALIEEGTPIIIILLNNEHRSYMESTISEVKSRGAYVIAITDICDHEASDIVIKIDSCGHLTSLLAAIPLQLIAYKLSILKGINPDKPRNLAKVVTVI